MLTEEFANSFREQIISAASTQCHVPDLLSNPLLGSRPSSPKRSPANCSMLGSQIWCYVVEIKYIVFLRQLYSTKTPFDKLDFVKLNSSNCRYIKDDRKLNKSKNWEGMFILRYVIKDKTQAISVIVPKLLTFITPFPDCESKRDVLYSMLHNYSVQWVLSKRAGSVP